MNVQDQPTATAAERHLPFERVALVLQGGGALGAYQAGVYEALSESGIDPNWISGKSMQTATDLDVSLKSAPEIV